MVEIETIGKIIRGINISAAVFVAFVGVYQIITLQIFTQFQFLRMWSIFTPLFMILFGAMLIGIDMNNAILFEYCQFLVSFFGRGVFYIFLGSIASFQMIEFSKDGGFSLTYVWGLLLFLFGLLFIGFHFTSAGGKLDELKQVKNKFIQKKVEKTSTITS